MSSTVFPQPLFNEPRSSPSPIPKKNIGDVLSFSVSVKQSLSISRSDVFSTNLRKSNKNYIARSTSSGSCRKTPIESIQQCQMEGSVKYAADLSSVKEAQERISPYVHKTPVLSSHTVDSLAGRNLHFKCECFQKCGAFKFRGACNAVFSLTDEQAAKGVVTHSSGNHAAALSLAAKIRGIPAHIVIPKTAPKCKVENVKRYGGQVVWSEPTVPSREEVAARVIQETGALLIPSSNDGRIISGQGTIALELLEQVPHIDTIIVPISGGGMVSGIAVAAKAINPSIRVLGAEPRGADDAARSKAKGSIVTLPEVKTIADGLVAVLGNNTWPIVRDLVDEIIVVEDKQIIEAMSLCYQILKVAVEPSAAIGLAVVLSESFRNNPSYKDCKNVGIILSGGNVDLEVMWESYNKKI